MAHSKPPDYRIEDGLVGPAEGAQGSPPCLALPALEDAQQTLRFDKALGWPPRVQRVEQVRPLTPERWERAFPLSQQRAYVAAARSDRRVKALLSGRCELLACHLMNPKGRAPGQRCVRVCFANYTEGYLVEASMVDQRVVSVTRKPGHAHPEAPIEMAQAIAIARADPRLKTEVAGLQAHAILQVPHPRSPHPEHRCLLVMFTEADDPHRESPTKFSAIVDLNLQQVITAGPCPCATASTEPAP